MHELETTSRPLVSVVITTYFRNESLARAIESVLEQNYDPIELIVVDGSGEAHAQAVVGEYEGIEYLPQAEDEGAQAARSVGAEEASGVYLNFLDDDDTLLPEKVSKQVEVLENNPGTGVVYCGKVAEDGREMLPNPRVQGEVLEYALKFQMTPSHPSTMLIRMEVLRDILPLGNRHGADDMGMKIELARRTEFDFVNEALVRLGGSEESLGGSFENIEGRNRLLEQYADLYNQHPRGVRHTAVAYTYLLEAELLLNQKWWSLDAITKAFLANWYKPGVSVSFLGFLCSAFFGRPGRDLGRHLYMKYYVGDRNRGKIA